METRLLPTNIEILALTPERLKGIREITSLDITDGATGELHPDGLYSVEIFGPMGDEERDHRFSYVDLRTEILVPKVFRDLIKLKSLYKGILSGKVRAVWDPELKDFVASNIPEAESGYGFFMSHWKEIEFKRTKSPARQQRVEFMDKYRDRSTTRYAVIIPSGLRDIEISESGRTTVHEINDLYFRIRSIANTVTMAGDPNSSVLDVPRYQLTMTYLQVYEVLEQLVEGKRGFALNKFASRRVAHSTRNVISAAMNARSRLGAKNSPGHNHTTVGLWQLMRMYPLHTTYFLRTMTADIFEGDIAKAPLINKDTLSVEYVDLSPEERDLWTSNEGLNDVINSYVDKEARHRSVMIADHYLFLVYQDDRYFKIFRNIDDLPQEFDRAKVRPITLCELLYLSGYQRWNEMFIYTTRYPVTGIDSIYPSYVYVKTTSTGKMLMELDDQWQPKGEEFTALEYPERSLRQFWDSQSPASSRLAGLGGDYDGDTASGVGIFTDGAIEKTKRFLQTRAAWISLDGQLRASSNYDNVTLMTRSLTGRNAPR